MSNAFSLDKIKDVDDDTLYLTSGYLRNEEKLLNITIPEIISVICTLYLYRLEYFTKHGAYITLGGDGDTARYTEDSSKMNTVYGSINIVDDGSKYIWTLKILSKGLPAHIDIGICDSNKYFIHCRFGRPGYRYLSHVDDYLEEGFDGDNMSNTNYYSWDGYSVSNMMKQGRVYLARSRKVFKVNDIVQMELDTKEKTIRYSLNGTDLGIAFDQIVFDYCYNFAVSLGGLNTCVKLVNFEHLNID